MRRLAILMTLSLLGAGCCKAKDSGEIHVVGEGQNAGEVKYLRYLRCWTLKDDKIVYDGFVDKAEVCGNETKVFFWIDDIRHYAFGVRCMKLEGTPGTLIIPGIGHNAPGRKME